MSDTTTNTATTTTTTNSDQNAGGNAGGNASAQTTDNKSFLDVDAIKKPIGNDPPAPAAQQKTDPAQAEKDIKPVDQPGQKETRPEWLKDDRFWDAEKGRVRVEDLNKSFNELERKISAGDHKAPAKAEDYKLKLNDDQKKILFGSDKANPMDDVGIKGVTAWGVKHKISQDAMNDLLSVYADMVEPQVQSLTIDIEKEKAALGKNADAIIQNNVDFIGHLYRSGTINDAEVGELKILLETAAGVKVLQKIRQYYGEAPIPMNASSDAGMPSRDELAKMLNSPEYEKDPEYKAKVDQMYAKRYGSQPAMSSRS